MREAAGPWELVQGCPKAKPPWSLSVRSPSAVGLGPSSFPAPRAICRRGLLGKQHLAEGERGSERTH